MKPFRQWINFRSPYTCMAIVVVIYCAKTYFKIAIGSQLGSIAMKSDGFHNLSDILEALVVMFAIYVASRPRSDRFPLGLAAIENIVSLEIGILVILLGLSFLASSLGGLLHYLRFDALLPAGFQHWIRPPQTRIPEGETFLYGLAVMILSVLLSLFTSTYQISLGKTLKSPSLISDGKESLSDSLVEISVLAGVLGKQWGLPYLDTLAGLLISVFILRTGTELVVNAAKVLLNISIDKQELKKVEETIHETTGVRKLSSLYAYTIGKDVFAVAEVAVSEDLRFGAVHHMRSSIERKVLDSVPGVGRVFLTFIPEEPEVKRCLLGIGKDRGIRSLIVDDFLRAKNYVVIEVERDRMGSVSIFPNRFQSESELAAFIKDKKVDTIYWVEETKALKEQLPPNVHTEETEALILGDLFVQ